jgi:hypothetical protein
MVQLYRCMQTAVYKEIRRSDGPRNVPILLFANDEACPMDDKGRDLFLSRPGEKAAQMGELAPHILVRSKLSIAGRLNHH